VTERRRKGPQEQEGGWGQGRLEREILPEKKPRKVWQNDMKEWVIMLE
jgi:hypothetical protein